MAVEIPVIVDIEQAFQDAAKRVSTAIKPLQREISKEALDFKIGEIKLDDTSISVTLRNIKEKGADTFGGLSQWIIEADKQLVKLAADGNEAQFKALLEAKHYLQDMDTAAKVSRSSIEGLANTMQGLSAKTQAARAALETSKIGSESWEKAAVELRECANEAANLQRRVAEIGTKTGSIDALSLKLDELRKKWSSMGSGQMFDASGGLTRYAQNVQKEYTEVANKLEKQNKLLNAQIEKQREAEAEAKRREQAELKAIEKEIEAEERRKKALAEHRAALTLSADSIDNINKRLAAWTAEMNSAKFGSEQFEKAAYQVAVLSEKLKEATRGLAELGVKSTSIDGLNASLQRVNQQWNKMSAAEKFTDSRGLNMTAEAKKLYAEYKLITDQLQRHGRSLAEIARREQERERNIKRNAQTRQYENTILNTTVKNMRILQEQERILSERLNTANVGSSKYEKLKTQIKAVRAEIQELNRDIAGGGPVANIDTLLQKADSRLASIVKRSIMLVGLHSATRFVHNIREVTSQFEMQRVALAGIIQDTAEAESLFKRLKAAALQSPFEIKDLVRFTKELSAYRIETDKLYDVTMQLADISAGLGVDMSRLVLAYGQVRAASVLRGQELRQFTEAGIPLVELLADKFTELNGRMVSTADVFELISKRAVPFKMIEEIFNDMTSAGGTFYKMQERQSETLLGQWMKLKDALSIMYDEIGNTSAVHGAMESLMADAMSLMRNWRLVGGVIKGVGVQLIGMKLLSTVMPSLARNAKLAKQAEDALAKSIAAADLAARTGSASFARQAKNLERVAMHMRAAANSTNFFTQTWHRMAASLGGGGWIGIAITAVSALIGYLISAKQEAERLGKALTENISKGNVQVSQSIRNFERLAKTAVSAANGSVEQREALQELNRTYSDIIPKQDLEIDKLVSLRGNYDSLTEAIRKKIEMQVHEQNVNQITDTYGANIGKQQRGLEKVMKAQGFSVEEASRIIGGINEAIKEGIIDSETEWYTLINKVRDIMYEQAGRSDWDVAREIAGARGVLHYNTYLQDFIKLSEELNVDISNEDERFRGLNNELGRYAEQLDELRERAKKVPEGFTYNQIGTFEYNQAQWKQAVEEYKKKITELFGEETAKEAFKADNFIDFKSIIGKVTGDKKYLKKFVEEMQKDYLNMAPQDNTTRLVTQALSGFVGQAGLSMTEFQGYLKQDGQAMDAYAKSVKEWVEAQQLKVKTVKFEQKNYAPGVSNYVRPTDEDIKKEEQELGILEKLLAFVREFLKETKKGGYQEDPWILIYKNRLKFVQDFSKGVQDLNKFMEQNNAIAKERSIMEGRGLNLGFTGEDELDVRQMTGSREEVMKWYDDTITKIQKKIEELGGKKWAANLGVQAILAKDTKNRTLKAWQQLLAEVFKQKTDFDLSQTETDMKRALDKLKNDIKRSEEAKNLFKDILSLTGDEEIATNLAVSVYGEPGEDLGERIKKSLKGTLTALNYSEDSDIFKTLMDAAGKMDFREIMKNIDQIPENLREAVRNAAGTVEKYNLDIVKSYAKLLVSYNDIAQQEIEITNKKNEKIATLEKGLAKEKAAIKQRRDEDVATIKALNMPAVGAALTAMAAKRAQDETEAAEERARAASEAITGQYELDMSRLKTDYRMFFNSVGVLSKKSAQNVAANQKAMLRQQLANQEISFAKYKRELKEIDAQLSKYSKDYSLTRVLFTDGVDAAINKLREYSDSLAAFQSEIPNLYREGKITVEEDVETGELRAVFDDDAQEFLDRMDKVLNAGSLSRTFSGETLAARFNKFLNKFIKEDSESSDKAQKIANGLKQAGEAMGEGSEQMAAAAATTEGAVAEIAQAYAILMSLFKWMNDHFEDLERSETEHVEDWWSYAYGGISGFDSALNKTMSGDYFGAINDLYEGFSGLTGKVKLANKEIKKQGRTIDDLEYQYGRLGKAIEEAFGSDYIYNFNQQLANLQAQAEAYRAQAAAERDKGKKADEDTARGYEKSARETEDQISDMRHQLSEFFTGTDLTSAARDFAQAWIDAYKEFGNTTDAMKEKFNDMIENMVVNSLAAQLIQSILKPVFDAIDTASKDGSLTADEIGGIADMVPTAMDQINGAMTVLMNQLTSAGINLRQQVGSFTGISRDIANATEESINGLAAGINTQNFYMQHIDMNVAAILAHLTGGTTTANSGTTGEYVDPFKDSLLANTKYIPDIYQALQELLSAFNGVMTVNGTKRAIQVNMS